MLDKLKVQRGTSMATLFLDVLFHVLDRIDVHIHHRLPPHITLPNIKPTPLTTTHRRSNASNGSISIHLRCVHMSTRHWTSVHNAGREPGTWLFLRSGSHDSQ